MTKPKYDDDIGFDAENRTVAIGEEARAEQDRIINDPDAQPILLIASLDGDVGVRVYGPPSWETVQLLERVAAQYRRAVAHHFRRPD